jgi:transcriptional regulator with XRE-family HTH domain
MDNTDKKAGENLRRLLELRGFNYSSLARKVGVNSSNVQRWCEGKQQIRSENLKKILEILNITHADLFGDNPEPPLQIHDSFRMALMIPVDIYKEAEKFGIGHPIWEEVRGVFQNYIRDHGLPSNQTAPRKNHS